MISVVFLKQLVIVATISCSLCSLIFLLQTTVTAQFAGAPRSRRGLQPISEAHQLYCNHCLTSCADVRHQQGIQDNHFYQDNYENIQQETNVEAKIRLQCKCESVFDTKSRSITCKNMSGALGEVSTTSNNDNKNGLAKAKNQNQTTRLKTSAIAFSSKKTSTR